jgi:hypothetical protein
MKKIGLLLLYILCFTSACQKIPNDTPNCVKKIAESFEHKTTIKKMTDGVSIYWQVQTEGSPQIADDEFLFIFNDNCDTLCRVCFCPKFNCAVEINKLTEFK